MLSRAGFRPRRPARFNFSCGINRLSQALLFYVLGLLTAGVVGSAQTTETTAVVSPRFTGTPFIRSWNADDYGAAPVNWRVERHPRSGFIYAGNNFGVLEFDGAAWRLIQLPSEGPARTLAIDGKGEIWVGGYDEVCVLQPDAKGELRAIDVLARLPAKERAFGQLLHCIATPDGIYFASAVRLLLFRSNGTAQSWPVAGRVNGFWWQAGSLYASLGTDGVAQLTASGLAIVAPPPPSEDPLSQTSFRVLAARTEADGRTLLLTARGPYYWRSDTAAFETAAAADQVFFKNNPATSATFLADGRIAYGFVNGGLVFFDNAGRIVSQLDRAHGLPSNRVEHITTDPEGGLWVAQRIGLCRAQIDDGFAVHGTAHGLNGSPRTLHRFGRRLYIAHNEGGAWRDDVTGRFQKLTGLQSGLNTFLQVGERLFATGSALYEIMPDDSARRMLPFVLSSLEAMPGAPGCFIGGNTTGLWLLRFDDKTWRVVGKISTVAEGVSSVFPLEDGSVWCAPYSGHGAWRVDFKGTPTLDAPAVFFGESTGLPNVRRRDEMHFCRIGADVIATTGQWVRRYDDASRRFVEITTSEGSSGPISTAAAPDGKLHWFFGPPEAHLSRVISLAGRMVNLERVAGGPVSDLIANSAYYDPVTDNVWIAGQGALISADLHWRPSTPMPPLRVMIRRVMTPTGETLFANSGLGAIQPTLPDLDHRYSALRFNFAAPTQITDYRGRSGTLYRTRLEGLDAHWTEWTTSPTREFTNLPYRTLVFHVQARDLSGRTSAENLLTFTLLPPWWLSNWACALYAVLGALIFFGIVWMRTRALRLRAAQLEAVVSERTAELASRNRELARLHKLEFNEKTTAKLGEEKAQLEMLRYQLNPHFLYNALGSIRSLVHSRPDEADEMTTQLADFCRMTLTRGEGEGGTLANELRMITSYLDMERTRWRERLKTKIDAEPSTLTLKLPPFLLLPLVENAIKYGTRTSEEVVQVIITVRPSGTSGLLIEVANTGLWVEPTGTRTPFSTGIGLENLKERLQRYFPGAHAFATSAGDGWVRATLQISSTENFKPALENA